MTIILIWRSLIPGYDNYINMTFFNMTIILICSLIPGYDNYINMTFFNSWLWQLY